MSKGITVKQVTHGLFDRYRLLIESLSPEEGDEMSLNHLKWMCEHALKTKMPLDKLSRWLGYVQGVLTCKGLISVEEERNFSRPWFHAAYNRNKKRVPMTINRNTTEQEVNEHNGPVVGRTEDMPDWMAEQIIKSMEEYLENEI